MPPLRLPGLFPALSLTLASLFPIVSCMCYSSNGSAVLNWGPDSVYQPCSNDSSNPLSTICCAINRSNPSGGNIANGFTQDICLPSGLCQNILVDANGDTVYAYWRDFCTVNDYKSSKCLDVCTGNGQEASAGGTAELTPCGINDTVTKWCCGHNNTACCFEDSAQNIPVFLGISSTTSTPTSASITTTSPPPTASSSTSSNSGLTTGDKAGIGVGVASGVLFFIGLGLSIACFRPRRKEKPAAYELHTPQGAYSDAPKYAQFSPAPLSELGGGEVSELAAEGTEGGRGEGDGAHGAPVGLA